MPSVTDIATRVFTVLLTVENHRKRGITPHCEQCKQMFTGDTPDDVFDAALKHYGLYPMTATVALMVAMLAEVYETMADVDDAENVVPPEVSTQLDFNDLISKYDPSNAHLN
jgi:hypothetical protein